MQERRSRTTAPARRPRHGAWLGLLAVVWSLLTPLLVQGRLSPPVDHLLLAEICSVAGPLDKNSGSEEAPGSTTFHGSSVHCALCPPAGAAPPPQPALAGRHTETAALRLPARAQRSRSLQAAAAPPLPARGPPRQA